MGIKVSRMILAVSGGVDLGEATIEAIKIAVAEWRNVEFEFNEKRYRFDVNDMYSAIQIMEDVIDE